MDRRAGLGVLNNPVAVVGWKCDRVGPKISSQSDSRGIEPIVLLAVILSFDELRGFIESLQWVQYHSRFPISGRRN